MNYEKELMPEYSRQFQRRAMTDTRELTRTRWMSHVLICARLRPPLAIMFHATVKYGGLCFLLIIDAQVWKFTEWRCDLDAFHKWQDSRSSQRETLHIISVIAIVRTLWFSSKQYKICTPNPEWMLQYLPLIWIYCDSCFFSIFQWCLLVSRYARVWFKKQEQAHILERIYIGMFRYVHEQQYPIREILGDFTQGNFFSVVMKISSSRISLTPPGYDVQRTARGDRSFPRGLRQN